MPKISEVIRKLKKQNCRFESHGRNHDWWINTRAGQRSQVPRHNAKEIHPDTLDDILKEAGLK